MPYLIITGHFWERPQVTTHRFSRSPGQQHLGQRVGHSRPPSTPSGLGGSQTPPDWAPCQLLGRLEVRLGAIQLSEGFPQDAHRMVQGAVRSVTSPYSDGTAEVNGVQDLVYRQAGTHC